MNREEFVRPQVAAAILGVKIDQVRSLAESGRIATLRTLGGHRRYHLGDVEAVQRWRSSGPPLECAR